MSDRVFVDTNLLVYAHDSSAGVKHEKARELVERLWHDWLRLFPDWTEWTLLCSSVERTMKALFAIGLVILVLGVASLFVPIPRKERAGVAIGDVSLGVETTHKETVSPIVSAVLILAGAGMMIAGKRKSG